MKEKIQDIIYLLKPCSFWKLQQIVMLSKLLKISSVNYTFCRDHSGGGYSYHLRNDVIKLIKEKQVEYVDYNLNCLNQSHNLTEIEQEFFHSYGILEKDQISLLIFNSFKMQKYEIGDFIL